MRNLGEVLLHWAAAVSVVILGLLALFPEASHHAQVIGEPWNYIVGGVLGLTLVAFHFWMIVECVRGRPWNVSRVLWLIFLFLLPIASAVIYFLFTRSKT